MNNPTVSAPQHIVERTNRYLAPAARSATGKNYADTCRPANGVRRIRNITSGAPMMQLIDLVRQ